MTSLSYPIDLHLRLHSPLPVFWPYAGLYRGCRISTMPLWYIRWALRWSNLPARYHAALRAEEGFRALASDQAEGRH